MKDIFSGWNLYVLVDGKKVQEVAAYPKVVTKCSLQGVVTEIELVINYIDDNVLDQFVYSNKGFKLVIGDSQEDQITYAGWVYINKREIKGDKEEVVTGHYSIVSTDVTYPFNKDNTYRGVTGLSHPLTQYIK